MRNKIRLGISKCLLGEQVRYDGQHKYDPYLVDTLGRYVEYVGVCPEVECGLPVPRESMHLEGDPKNPRLITTKTRKDMTDRMTRWAALRVEELAKEKLCGFIFKSKSPSSGMEKVKVSKPDGQMAGQSPGLFAKEFIKRFPLLPVEEEGRLHDPDLRTSFIERVFTLNRFRQAMGEKKTAPGLIRFHAAHKYFIMAHSEKHMRQMGKLVGDITAKGIGCTWDEYEVLLLDALKVIATPKKHANVLEHMLGFFKKSLTADEKQEMLDSIEHHRTAGLPLLAPLTLMQHHVRKHKVAYLADQRYLNPDPGELTMLYHA